MAIDRNCLKGFHSLRIISISIGVAARRRACSSLSMTDSAGFVTPEKKCRAKAPKRQRSRRRRISHPDSDDSDDSDDSGEHRSRRKLIKTEQEMLSQPVSSSAVM